MLGLYNGPMAGGIVTPATFLALGAAGLRGLRALVGALAGALAGAGAGAVLLVLVAIVFYPFGLVL